MKILDLVTELIKISAKHGNVEIVIRAEPGWDREIVMEVNSTQGLILEKEMQEGGDYFVELS